MNKIIDCKGLNCPLPVVNTKKYFDSIKEGEATTIVDNEISKNNVLKLAQSNDFKSSVEEKENLYYIHIKKGIECSSCNEVLKEDKLQNNKFVVAVMTNKLGDGNDELGIILMKSYMFALSEADIIPTDLIFINSGVKLVTKNSEVLESLKKLEERGVKIQVCGTCLDFYKLKEELQIGEISNMYSIVETINNANKIIKL